MWFVLTSWGRLGFFKSQGGSWAFDGLLILQPQDTAYFDSVQPARDSFVATAGRQDQWPSRIKFLWVHFGAFSLMVTDYEQEAVVSWFSRNNSVQDMQVGNVAAQPEPLGHAP